MRQLVSGSGGLAVPAEALTQRVLGWCYPTSEASLGWLERDGLGVAFRRTPTGRDAAGRPGAFFVHALVWRSGSFPPELLPGLADAAIWTTAPPDDPPSRLPPLRTVDELCLGSPAAPPRDELLAALAAHLGNVAAGRGSYLALPPFDAFRLAAHVARALPRHYELPSFSTYEEANRAGDYDMLAAPEAPAASFGRIAPDGPADRLWRLAAGLLLDAAEGDESAAAVVDALSERAARLGDFASTLRLWVVLDDPGPAEPPQPGALAAAATEPRLLTRLLRGPHALDVGRAIVEGRRAREIAAAASRIGRLDALAAVVRDVLAAREPGPAVQGLVHAHDALGATGTKLAAELATMWYGAGELAALPPDDAAVLLRLLENAGVPEVGETLAMLPANAERVAGNPTMPAAWRGAAVAAAPHVLTRRRLVQQLVASPGFAEGFARAADAPAFAALRDAFAAVRPGQAYEALQRLDRALTEQQRSALALPVVLRLDPRARLAGLLAYAPAAAEDAEPWCEAALDTYVAIVMRSRSTVEPLPPLGELRLPPGRSKRAVAFARIAAELGAARRRALTLDACERALHAAAPLAGDDADAALEAVADAAADGFATRQRWAAAVRAVAAAGREDPLSVAARFARAAVRTGARDRREAAYWTVLWIAAALDRRDFRRGDLGRPPFDRLPRRLRALDAGSLKEDADAAPRGPARRWLNDVSRAVAARYDRR
jgi:hypothetical protein